MAIATRQATRIAASTGQPWVTNRTATMAELSPLTEPTERSIWPTSSTQTIPRAMTPTEQDSSDRSTRFWLDRKTEFRTWKTVQMTASAPTSPALARRKKSTVAPRTPDPCCSRSSARSSATAGAASVDLLIGGPLFDPGVLAEGGPAGHCIGAGTGDGGDDLLRCHVGNVELAIVAPETQDNDPVGDRPYILHVVA